MIDSPELIMKMIILAVGLTAGMTYGGGEMLVEMDRVTISSSQHKVEVTVMDDLEEGTSIDVSFEDAKLSVPKDVAKLFPNIQVHSLRILTHVPTGQVPEAWLENHPFIISFDFGDGELHGKEDSEVEVFARGRLYFHKAAYSGWEKYVPVGDFKNEWKMFMPNLVEGDGYNGTTDGIKCPLDN